MKLMTFAEITQALTDGPHAWPGGYPLYFVTHDCQALSFEAVRENVELVITSDGRDGWGVISVAVNWEDPDLLCAHTGKRIESSYAEDEADPEAPIADRSEGYEPAVDIGCNFHRAEA